jgi:hypothetical protein
MKAPTSLKHKPIISVDDYEKFEPTYPSKTDVRALSIGKAQYDQNDISLKVWRETDKDKISRQSEELPIHRNIDLTILFVSSLLKTNSSNSITRLGEQVVNITEISKIQDYYLKNKTHIDTQLKELKKLIDSLS